MAATEWVGHPELEEFDARKIRSMKNFSPEMPKLGW
jgi:hypothetical protein